MLRKAILGKAQRKLKRRKAKLSTTSRRVIDLPPAGRGSGEFSAADQAFLSTRRYAWPVEHRLARESFGVDAVRRQCKARPELQPCESQLSACLRKFRACADRRIRRVGECMPSHHRNE